MFKELEKNKPETLRKIEERSKVIEEDWRIWEEREKRIEEIGYDNIIKEEEEQERKEE